MHNLKSGTAEKEKTLVSANGVSLHSLKSPGLHSFCLCLYAKAGVLYENTTSGISHFVEHIAFRNINQLMGGNLYNTLDAVGLTFTAATYKEFMQFCITGESSKLPLGAEIITKLFEPFSNQLKNGDFETERDRIRAEIREYDEKASLDYAVKKKVFSGTSLSDMITGTLGSVSKITLSKCETERKSIFSQGNFFFYLTGNYDDKDCRYILELCEKYTFYKSIPRTNTCVLPTEYMNRKPATVTKDSAYCMVEFSFDMDTERFSKQIRGLFYDMMFAGENCRFFREMSENSGYVYSYDAKIEEYKNLGNLTVSYEVSYKNLYESLNKAAEIFAAIKKDASGLELAKVFYTDNACLMLDNAEELNFNMAYENYILGDFSESIDARREKYEKVNPDNICALARDMLTTRKLVFGIKGRKKRIDTERIENILKKLDK